MNATIKTTAALLAACGLTLAAAGCNGDGDDLDVTEQVDAGLNAGKLGGVPPAAQERILLDVGDRQIASSDISTGPSGPMYEVTYYDDGQPVTRTYDRDGNVMNLPANRQADARFPEATGPIRQSGEQGAARDVGDLGPRGSDVTVDPGDITGTERRPPVINDRGLGNVGGGGDIDFD